MTLLTVAVAGRGLVDPAQPVFRADDEALLRGGVAFETIRSYGGTPFLLDRHLARFDSSIAALALPRADGAAELARLAAAAAPPDHVLRLYRTEQVLVATAAALPAGLDELRARGLALRTVDVGAPSQLLAGAKTTSYGEAFAARRLAVAAGADDALLLAGDRVLDASTANVWAVLEGRVVTPPPGPGVLPGVTRSLVLELVDAEQDVLALTQLVRADELFTTSSIREVMPVTSIDGRAVHDGRPGPVAARLQAGLRLRSTP
jgi:branched-subunit amino acid aminotransferase/4-amino-4-deoxychorismate lyase